MKETLEQGLTRSANKKGLKGKARERYIIGGAIHSYQRKAGQKPTVKPVKPRAPRAPRQSSSASASAPAARTKIELVARKNADASSTRSYDVYSIYEKNKKTPYTGATYRTRSAAVQAAKVAQESHNHPKGIHGQNRLKV